MPRTGATYYFHIGPWWVERDAYGLHLYKWVLKNKKDKETGKVSQVKTKELQGYYGNNLSSIKQVFQRILASSIDLQHKQTSKEIIESIQIAESRILDAIKKIQFPGAGDEREG